MSLFQDAKFASRMLLRDPGFTAVMVFALALGIGVNATVFTLVNAVLFRGLPFEEPDRILYLSCDRPTADDRDIGVSFPDFRDWRAQSKTFRGLAGFTNRAMVIIDTVNAPERYTGVQLTANAFSLIGQKPFLGRDFRPEEDHAGAAPVVILGYSLWESRYGRDPNILGKSIRINDVPTTVVGVMPPGMKFPLRADLWTTVIPTADSEKRESRSLEVFGRLTGGASPAQARAEIQGISRQLARDFPKSNAGVTAVVMPYNDRFNGGPIRTVFLVLLGAVGFVLLIACANVANLLLARSLVRSREISIRAALGAQRWRVIRQLLVESVLVGLMGGAAGLGIAVVGVRWFDAAVANVGKPYWIVFEFDFTVFAYLAGICLATGILFGLAPALHLSKVDVTATLKEGGRGSGSSRRVRYLSSFLVVSEVALSIVLLVGAGLMIRSFLKAYGLTSGIAAEQYLCMRLSLPEKAYPNADARLRFYERLEPRLHGVPGVESAAIVSNLPMAGAPSLKFDIEGRSPVEEDKLPGVSTVTVSPGYFRTMSNPLLRGRDFEDSDGLPGKGTVVVNQRFAAKYWPGEDPLGKRLRLHGDGERPWLTVIALSRDFRQIRNEQGEFDPVVYVPYRGRPVAVYSLLIRATVPPTSLSTAFRKEIQAIDGSLPVFNVGTLLESFEQQRWQFRVFGTLFTVFALIALVLSAVGLYATMAYSVTRRTQEIGVRVAMGASSGSILYLVMTQGLRQLAIGLAVGLAGAFAMARVMKSLLVQVSPTDPTTFLTISAVLLTVGLFACWLPARAAMKVDPLVALRYE